MEADTVSIEAVREHIEELKHITGEHKIVIIDVEDQASIARSLDNIEKSLNESQESGTCVPALASAAVSRCG